MTIDSIAFTYALILSAAQLLSYAVLISYLGWVLGLLASFALALGMAMAAPRVLEGCHAAAATTGRVFASLRARLGKAVA